MRASLDERDQLCDVTIWAWFWAVVEHHDDGVDALAIDAMPAVASQGRPSGEDLPAMLGPKCCFDMT